MSKQIRIMSFNIWVDGLYGGQPLQRTADVIRQSGADIVGMQEVLQNTAAIADQLGWSYVQQAWDTAILSRFEIVELTREKTGARLRLGNGSECYLVNVHLAHAPYQPYQLLRIPYADAPFIESEAEAIAAAEAARGEGVAAILRDVADLPPGAPIFITGDFNEPSHLDWTAAAAAAGHHPIKVAYPSSKTLAAAGFADAYRRLYPDEVQMLGYTWPTVAAAQETDKDDRLDFVLFRGDGVETESVQIVGDDERFADIVVSPYPSDHRAVVATFSL